MKKFTFSVPIKESMNPAEGAACMKIKGEAIHAVVTRNKTKFTEDELKPSAKTLTNRPLLKDHNNSVDCVVGKVTEAAYDPETKCVAFSADVMDEDMCLKIKQGLVNAVSVGAKCELVPEVDEATGDIACYAAKNIEFLELSLVAIPADPEAGFERAIAEAFDLQDDEPILRTVTVSDANAALMNAQLAQQREEEAATMAEEQNKLEALRAERAKLEEEITAMQVEKLRAEKTALETAAKPAETEMKGKIAETAPATPSIVLTTSDHGTPAYEPSVTGLKNYQR